MDRTHLAELLRGKYSETVVKAIRAKGGSEGHVNLYKALTIPGYNRVAATLKNGKRASYLFFPYGDLTPTQRSAINLNNERALGVKEAQKRIKRDMPAPQQLKGIWEVTVIAAEDPNGAGIAGHCWIHSGATGVAASVFLGF